MKAAFFDAIGKLSRIGRLEIPKPKRIRSSRKSGDAESAAAVRI
jgi:hypothetical protein